MENKRKATRENHPKDDANVISHFLFCWQLPLLVKGWSNKIASDDFNTPLKCHDSKKLSDKLEKHWEEEMNVSNKPSLSRVLRKLYGLEYLFYGLVYFCFDLAITLSQPLFLGKLLNYYVPHQTTVTKNQAYWLRKNTLEEVGLGQIVNLMSNDLERFVEASTVMNDIWMAPIKFLLVVYFYSVMLTNHILTGIGVIIFYLLMQAYVLKKISTLRIQVAAQTDHRIRLLHSLISGIQTIKMFTWEKTFGKLVEQARKLESENITTTNLFRLINCSIKIYIHKLCTFLCILTIISSGLPLTYQYVFTLTSLYEILKASTAESFPLAEFLLLDNRGQTKTNYSSLNKLTPTTSGIFLKNVSAQWNAREEILSDVNFSADVGELVGIAGGAGSGKSTLLQVILKELEPTRGSVDVEMNISYAPQEPWIFSASVKQNILFGEELDESRYLKVLRMCALERDLSVFPFGDNTLVGERGVMLSGGQKARIGLARAVYRNAEIYLLDDPLSAVDGHVADHIFKECLLKFLRNKCLVLVTHQIHFLRNANKIYFLSNGKMMQDGKSELLESLKEKFKTNTNTTGLEELPAVNYNYQLEVKEDEGKAGNSYKSYCLAGGKGMTGLVLVLFVLVQILSNMVDGFVAFWVNIHQDSVNLVPQIYNFFTDQNCVYIYGALLIVLVFVCHAAVWANVKFCKKASENLHKNLLSKVLVASMSFFNNHSSGRVINRFSKDMGTIDEFIPMTLMEVTTLILSSVGASIVVIIVDFWMIIPSVMLSFVVYFYYAVFQYTIRKFRRMEGTRRSPIFTHLVASVQGLSVIRASNAQKILQEEFDSHQDRHSSCFYLYKALYFAFAFWTEVTCGLYNVVLIYSLLYFENVTVGGSVGLMITQMIVLTSSLQYVMTLMANLDAEMVSAARVVEYMDVTPEKDDATVIPFPAWPNAGKITFERVSMRYYLDKELVLKEISVKIQPKEKIGIVGRTGAGKSSLISALFCLFEFEGTVSIDGIDTKSVPLSTLRSRISIIPQEPVLFLGTLRKNLDSFGEFSDSELWSALEDVGLKKMVSGLQSGLDSLVSEGGSNFSVGEKQLLCLVRAIVKNTKIVVLDEATASVDLEADDMIQRTIRRNFKNSTVLTIAHRLNTVMDSDKIMVMDSGRVVEFGDPKELLENPDGHFYRYVSSSLVKIPKKNYK
ncbi:hypothetical protein MTP99_004963 [Tenebrio molitor]|nr:hypothetical protein MTP99_004963 [Tenebrio molitor]